MTTGLLLWITLGIFIGGWLTVDLVFWLIGWQTASQWTTAWVMESKFKAILALLFIVLLASWLIFHFEIPEAVMKVMGI